MKRNYRMLERLYVEGRATWFQIAAKILNSRRDQEDAVQNGFFRWLRCKAHFADLKHAQRYVALAVYHSAIDLRRRNEFRENLIRPTPLFPDGNEKLFC